jgi:hypothetical protein
MSAAGGVGHPTGWSLTAPSRCVNEPLAPLLRAEGAPTFDRERRLVPWIATR